MTKILNLFNPRYYLRPLSTTNELFRLRKYFNYQRFLTSKYNHQEIFQSLPIRVNSIKSDIDQNSIPKPQINSQLELKPSINSIKHIDTPIIKLNICSTLIATGHGIAPKTSSLIDMNTKQVNYETLDEDISLSKTCRKILNR